MHIEVFPAEKSCEQGCPTCPLARKDRVLTAISIDSEVQKTFSLIEQTLKKLSITYNLHTTSALHLFPTLQHPELIRMARFETGPDICVQDNPRHFSDNLRMLLASNDINPRIIGFSIVPEYPVISTKDAAVIGQIIDELHNWYLTKYKTIEVTIRSNLIKPPLFHEVSANLFNADKIHLKNVLKERAKLHSWSRRPFLRELTYYHLYLNSYGARIGSNKIIATNRVIATKKAEDIQEMNIHNAMTIYPYVRDSVDFAIAPKGVMLMHSSITINNPVLWINHDDFRRTLLIESAKPEFSILRFTQKRIMHNAVMYQFMLKHKKEGVILADKDFLDFFEKHRLKFFP